MSFEMDTEIATREESLKSLELHKADITGRINLLTSYDRCLSILVELSSLNTRIEEEKLALVQFRTRGQSLEIRTAALEHLFEEYEFSGILFDLIQANRSELANIAREHDDQVKAAEIADCFMIRSPVDHLAALKRLSVKYEFDSNLKELLDQRRMRDSVELFNAPVRDESLKPW